ncbi:MAG: hypothetical protein NWE89_13245 [Candidatus Bathyarchaeota archaeon]|nr:hypothetical protein [Candidatus Bathyarchaeota archaeon]
MDYEVEIMNEATLAADSTIPTTLAGTECTVIPLTNVGALALTVEVTFGPDNTGNVVAHLKSSPTGSPTDADVWDTEDFGTIVVTCVQDTRVQVTKDVVVSPKAMKVQMVNEDDTYGVGPIVVTHITSII